MTTSPELQKAVSRLNIADVVVKNVTASLADLVVPGVTFQATDPAMTQFKHPQCDNVMMFPSKSGSERLVVYELLMGVRILRGSSEDLANRKPEEMESEVIGTIEAAFYVSYLERPDADGEFLEEDCVNAFAIDNVAFNAWPYWRELVQSACSRLALPRIVLPTHRLQRRMSPPPQVVGAEAPLESPNVKIAHR